MRTLVSKTNQLITQKQAEGVINSYINLWFPHMYVRVSTPHGYTHTRHTHIQILKVFFQCRLNMCISDQAFLLMRQWFWDLPILVGSWGVWEARELCSGASEAVSWSATKKGEKQNSATTEISLSHISLKIIVHRAWLLPTSGGCAETQSPNSVIWICTPLLAHLLGDLAESTAYWDPCVQGHLAVAGKGHLLCPSAHTCLSVALFVHLHVDIFLFQWGNILPSQWSISPVAERAESQCYYQHIPQWHEQDV